MTTHSSGLRDDSLSVTGLGYFTDAYGLYLSHSISTNALRSFSASWISLLRFSYRPPCFSLSVFASSFFRAATLLMRASSFWSISLGTPDEPALVVRAILSENPLALVTSLESILPAAWFSFILTRVSPLAGSERGNP